MKILIPRDLPPQLEIAIKGIASEISRLEKQSGTAASKDSVSSANLSVARLRSELAALQEQVANLGSDEAATTDGVFESDGSVPPYRAVYEKSVGFVALADASENLQPVIGISVTADGTTVTVRTEGVLQFESWSWTPGLVFVGESGELTQAKPAPRSTVIGYAISQRAIRIAIDITSASPGAYAYFLAGI
jgi:hypothetical protein